MNETASPTFEDVKEVVIETLELEDLRDSLTPSTELLGSLPGLDSMSVLLLLTALGERFGFDIEDADISGDTFETLGTLTAYIETLEAD